MNTTKNETSLVCNLVPVTFTSPPPSNVTNAPTQPTNTTMSANTTESTATTAQPMVLECINVTGEVVVSVPVNTSNIEGRYYTINIPGSCEDYEVRYQCQREIGNYLGCFDDTEVSSTSNTNLPNLTPDDCKYYCSAGGYRLAAIQSSSNLCSCSNSLSSLPIQYDQCSLTCSSLPCGGTTAKSVYLTECNMNFGLSTNQMDGTKLHNNDGSDDYGTWYTTMTGGDVTLFNYTNAGSQMDLVLRIDLESEKTVSLIQTDGMYVNVEELHGGVNSFYVGYQHDADHDIEFYMDHGSSAATLFTVSDLTSAVDHKLNRLITARFLYIYVLTYEYFPGLKVELKGCAD
ncbi:uncharacterized protein [Ptychodera flava]|uniref:uncharacterized protein n=1 Tax=Ptychodera flava TaxID=63121 RepID=UPI00396A0E28